MSMKFEDYADIPEVLPSSTSYFSAPSSELDPKLFIDSHLRSWVRDGILSLLFEYMLNNFNSPHAWTRAWLAGSGVSYQWEASRQPGDLDCLVGINYVKFRQMNTEYVGFSDQEIAKMFNEGFNEELMPNTKNWEGYELTFYVNPQSDIRDINPYAAYDLIMDDWTVTPDKNPQPPYSRDWEYRTNRDHATAIELLTRYSNALKELRYSVNPAYKVNAEKKIKLAEEQAIAFYEDIHKSRKIAFSPVGAGYSDFNNYRWQAGKRSGIVQSLRAIKEQKDQRELKKQLGTYGVELPTSDTLLRRSMRG